MNLGAACGLCHTTNVSVGLAWFDAELCLNCAKMVALADLSTLAETGVSTCRYCEGGKDADGRTCLFCIGLGSSAYRKSALEQLGGQADGPT